jgi:predicted 3-demethylubiquinone-9 3-methyltransferase (glyoxalase superfamily)
MTTIGSHNTITPHLWFDTQLGDAIDFYSRVFPDSRVISESRAPEGVPDVAPGTLFTAEFELNGQRFRGLNAGPQFRFNEAISLWVHCENQEEVDYFWDALTADGGEESQCGWLKDRFGLSWQIVPRQLEELMADPQRAARVTQVLLGQRKLVIAELEAA